MLAKGSLHSRLPRGMANSAFRRVRGELGGWERASWAVETPLRAGCRRSMYFGVHRQERSSSARLDV